MDAEPMPAASQPDARLDVRRSEERSRYELFEGDTLVGIADFVRHGDGGTLVLPHTEIAPSRRGQGLGDVLVGRLLADVRARGERVVPACWFVSDFVASHPEHADLLAGG